MRTFRLVFFSTLGVLGVAIAVSWGLRSALVYSSFVALVGGSTYAAGVASELLRRLSARRFVPDRPRS